MSEPQDHTNAGRVLVFGDDGRIALAVIRSLGRSGKEVHVAPFDWHSPTLESRYISTVHRLPRYSDDADRWVEAVETLLQQNAFDLVVACCDDRTILPFHQHRSRFSSYRIAIPNPQSIDALFDKAATRQLCARLGVPVVDGEVLKGCWTAGELGKRFGFPLVVKPRRSFSIDHLDILEKVAIVDDEPQLERVLANLSEPSAFLIERYFEGEGGGLSVLANSGEILVSFQHRRLHEGRGGCSSYRVSEEVDPEIIRACSKICQELKFSGVCMFEFRKKRETGEWILIEVNARFWGSLPLPVSLGVDFPTYLYDLMVHGRAQATVSYPAGIRSRNIMLDANTLLARLSEAEIRQLPSLLADFASFGLQPLSWMTGRERSDSIVLDDIRPGIAELLDLLARIRRRRSRLGTTGMRRRRADHTVPDSVG